MDVKFFLITTVAITAYIVLGGLLFQFLERKPSDNNNNQQLTADDKQESKADIFVVHPIEKSNFFETANVDAFLRKVLRQALSVDGFKVNLTVRDRDNQTVAFDDHSNGQLLGNLTTVSASGGDNLFLHVAVTFERRDRWDLYDSIVYAETLVTTIGYGQIAPLTVAGRLVSCLYAIFGIPLLGVWLGSIGEGMLQLATRFRKSIKVKKRFQRQILIFQAIVIVAFGSAIFIFLPALLFSSMENWLYSDGIYYCVVSLGTIGLGDLVAASGEDSPGWYRFLWTIWLFFGLGWLSMIITLSINIFRTKATKVVQQAGEKVVQTVTEIQQKLTARRMIARRNSFSGKRQISVMLSKTSSAVQIFDTSSGSTRLVTAGSEEDPTSRTPGLHRQMTFLRTTNIVLVSDEAQQGGSPRVMSRQSSAAVSVRPTGEFGHQVSHLPTITENDNLAQDLPKSQKYHRTPSFIIGNELVVQTSKRRPSLGANSASILLFDKNLVVQERIEDIVEDDDMNNTSTLEQISQEQAMADIPNIGIVINVVAPEGDDWSESEEERRSSLRRRSSPVAPPLSGRLLPLPGSPQLSVSQQASQAGALRKTSIFENGATTIVNPDATSLKNLVVMTDNGIAESLGKEITILRPRSKTIDY